MADKYKIKLNRSGVRKLLRGQEMQNELSQRAFACASRCGDGYKAFYSTEQTRAIAGVTAATAAARRDNSKNNTLLKMLEG